jgi:uncharacterized membrane protein
MTGDSSTGLPPRLAAALAYAGWWVTGALLWLVERRDPFVRFHAAQSFVVFGVSAIAIAGFMGLAAVALQVLPSAFSMFLGAAGVTAVAAVLLWLVAVTQALRGVRWRVPALGALAERLASPPRTGS